VFVAKIFAVSRTVSRTVP